MMQKKTKVWKKTAAATMALSLIAGSATGLVASAKSNHGNNGNGPGKGNSKVNIQINLQFKDVDEASWQWAYPHIVRLAAQGVFKGYDDGSFKPRNNITRVETIVASVRLLGLEAEAQKPENMNAKLNFKDFDQMKKKYPNAVGYVAVALQNDLFNENDTVIQADKPATRLWASVLLVKSMKLEAEAKARMNAELPFKDENQVPAGSVGYVAVAVEKGLVAGYSDKTFQPNKPVTRAELASILDRLGVQLPNQGQQDSSVINGTVTASAGGVLTVKKADATTVNVALDAGVFVFREDKKVAAAALQVGDEVLVRTYEGKAVFIDVTKAAAAVPTALSDAGKVNAFTFDASGKIATLSLIKDVNGVQTTVVYNVDPAVTITGGSGVLAANLTVTVVGQNNIVKAIVITG